MDFHDVKSSQYPDLNDINILVTLIHSQCRSQTRPCIHGSHRKTKAVPHEYSEPVFIDTKCRTNGSISVLHKRRSKNTQQSSVFESFVAVASPIRSAHFDFRRQSRLRVLLVHISACSPHSPSIPSPPSASAPSAVSSPSSPPDHHMTRPRPSSLIEAVTWCMCMHACVCMHAYMCRCGV
jgi:hypothetical protein